MSGQDTGPGAKGVDRPVGYWQLLRENPRFRRLWLAEVVSFFGDWFNTIALYAAVTRLTGSAEAVATVFVAKLLPIFLLTPVAGPLVDRFDRRKLLIGTDIARALCAVGLIVAYRDDNLPALLVLQAVMMGFAGIFIPAKTAVVPQLTTRPQLAVANALSSATWSVMLALGAALGGIVTGIVGVEASLLIDGLTFLLSAALLVPLPRLRPYASGRRPRRVDRGFVAGLRYLRGRPYLAAVISLKAGLSFGAAALAMIPLLATRVFPATSGAIFIGLLYTTRGVGALLGSLSGPWLFGDSPRAMRRLIAPAMLLAAAAHLGISQASNIWLAAAGYLAASISGGLVWVSSTTLGQIATANEYRGRVFAVEWGMMTLAASVTAWLGGVAVDRLGWDPQLVVLVGSGLLVLPAATWAFLMVVLRLRPPESTPPERSRSTGPSAAGDGDGEMGG